MKNLSLLSYCALLICAAFNAVAEDDTGDISINLAISELSQPVTFINSSQQLNALTSDIQLAYHASDWSLGVSYSGAENDIESQINNKRTEYADLSMAGYEVYGSYYLDDWALSVSYGEYQTDYELLNVSALPSTKRQLAESVNRQFYSSNESLFRLNVSKWIDISNIVNQLSISPTAGISHLTSSGEQGLVTTLEIIEDNELLTAYLEEQNKTPGVQRAGLESLSDSQWIYDVGLAFDYLPPALNDNWMFSLWISHEFVSSSDGVITTSRLGNGQRVVHREFPLDELGESAAGSSVTSYGLSVDYSVTETLSTSVGWFDSDISEPEWQLGVSYFF